MSRLRLAWAVLSVTLCLSPGCTRKVLLLSSPPGAEVRYRGQTVGVTPVELKVPGIPGRRTARLSANGYRTVEVNLGNDLRPRYFLGDLLWPPRWRRLVGVEARSHEVILVPRHGRAGTWTPDDVEAAN